MSDESAFYAPGHHRTVRPRQPRPGELAWSIRKDGRQYDCELRVHGEWGVEVQVLCDRELLFWHRWPRRDLALEEAGDLRAQYLREGGTPLT